MTNATETASPADMTDDETRTADILVPWTLYVVERDPSRSYGSLHTITSDHLLTPRPGAGDRIVATLGGQRRLAVDRRGGYECVGASLSWGGDRGFRLTRHAGRSPRLGEDGLEDAYGGDALDDLVPEILCEAEWNYAPIAIEWEPEDYDPGDNPDAWAPEMRRWKRVTGTREEYWGGDEPKIVQWVDYRRTGRGGRQGARP